ncbi:MAG: OadG family protein [Marinifilaceae bacterium]
MIHLIQLNTAEVVQQVGGYTISFVGYFIVFLALIILVCIFSLIPKILRAVTNRRNGATPAAASAPTASTEMDMDAQTNVAIAAAIHLYFNEMHDFESNVITIRTANKQYSPWNSKIYGVNNQPVRR